VSDLQIPWFIEPEQRELYIRWLAGNNREEGPSAQDTMALIKACPAFLGHYYTNIQTADATLVRFQSWTPAQIKLYRVVRNLVRMNLPVRVVVLKARQMGISTLIELLAYWRTAFFPNITGLIAAQEEDAATRIFEMFRVFYSTTPDVIRPDTEKFSVEEIRFGSRKTDPGDLGLASRILTKTTALGGSRKDQQGKGRGATYHFFHGSEVAFWANPHRFMSGVTPGLHKRPNIYGFLESTARGSGNWFHRRWRKAAEGWRLVKQPSGPPRWMCDGTPGLWIPVFLSWLEHPAYRVAIPGAGSEKELAYYTKHMDKEERRLVNEFGATPEQIEWRRVTLEDMDGDLELFCQEYPAEPEEAFQSTGRRVFDMLALQRYSDAAMATEYFRGSLIRDDKDKLFRSEDPHGALKIWREPKASNMYVIGADPCIGRSPEGDNACAQVLCATSDNPEESWEQVAVWCDRVDPDEFAQELLKLAEYYGTALIVCEVNGPGQTTDLMLQKANYWNRYRRVEYDKITNQRVLKWGWHTNTKTRSVMVGSLKGAIREMRLKIHDPDTLEEMRDWVRIDNGRGSSKEAPSDPVDGRDDRVIALGLALQGGLLDNPMEAEDSEVPAEPQVSAGPRERYLATRGVAGIGGGSGHPVLGSDW
jgi:hypothetical protein